MQIRLFKILKNIHDLVNINKVFIFIKFFEKKSCCQDTIHAYGRLYLHYCLSAKANRVAQN